MNDIVDYHFLSLDLEMNQPSGKIIEVGVAIGSLSEGIRTIHNWFVDPEEPISEDITSLTGIDNETIRKSCVSLNVVANKIGELITLYNCFVNPVQWGGGDSQKLVSEFRNQGIDFPYFGRREIDVKTICTYLAMVQGKKPSGGLKSYVARYGLKFRGTPHRAAVDAENTLSLWFELMKRQRILEEGCVSLKSVKT